MYRKFNLTSVESINTYSCWNVLIFNERTIGGNLSAVMHITAKTRLDIENLAWLPLDIIFHYYKKLHWRRRHAALVSGLSREMCENLELTKDRATVYHLLKNQIPAHKLDIVQHLCQSGNNLWKCYCYLRHFSQWSSYSLLFRWEICTVCQMGLFTLFT